MTLEPCPWYELFSQLHRIKSTNKIENEQTRRTHATVPDPRHSSQSFRKTQEEKKAYSSWTDEMYWTQNWIILTEIFPQYSTIFFIAYSTSFSLIHHFEELLFQGHLPISLMWHFHSSTKIFRNITTEWLITSKKNMIIITMWEIEELKKQRNKRSKVIQTKTCSTWNKKDKMISKN